MTARVCFDNFPSSASQDQPRPPSSTRGGAVSDRPALPALHLVEAESQSALMQALAPRPVWVDGTLAGVMAGKRPARKPTGSI